MKRKIVLMALIVCIVVVAYLLIVKNSSKDIYSSLVYIESISNEEIKTGSGFVYKIDNGRNYIITSYHVIENSSYINVYNKKKQHKEAFIESYDEYNDIAVLYIDNDLGFKSAKLGNSDRLKINEDVYVVGNPLNIENFATKTKGKVLDLNALDDIFDFSVIEISASVDYGSSGSPVINKKGQVIGMVFLKKDSSESLSFVIPINYILNRLKEG